MCMKCLVYCLSHNCRFDIIDCDVSTTYCRSSSGNSVDLLSRTTVKPVYNSPVYSGDPVYYGHWTTSQKLIFSCSIFSAKLT